MSNYSCQIKIKSTGEIHDATALDNFFGKHKYGYKLNFQSPISVYKEEEVEELPLEEKKAKKKSNAEEFADTLERLESVEQMMREHELRLRALENNPKK
jgi:hypothetical protein